MSEFYAQDDNDGWEQMFSEPEAAAPESEGTPEPVVEDAAPAEVVDTAEAEEPQEAAPERPRNEKGQFVKAEAEESTDDLRARLEAAERRLADKDEYIGRQSNEVGELRRALEERLAGLEQSVQQPRYAPTQITAELIEQNPGAAVQLAYEQQNPQALQIAMEAWKYEDPFAAASWVSQRQMEALNSQWQERYQQLEQRFEPVAQTQGDREFARGLREITETHGPLEDIIARAEQANIPQRAADAIRHALEHGTPEQRIGAIEALALLSSDRPNADTLNEAVQANARQAAAEADRAIAEAAVASATQTRSEPPARSLADDVWGAADTLDVVREDGWNIGR